MDAVFFSGRMMLLMPERCGVHAEVEQEWWRDCLVEGGARLVAAMRSTRLFMYAADCPTQYLARSVCGKQISR